MLLQFEKEIWICKFAEKLSELQPRFPVSLARSIASDCWPYLGTMMPADAAIAILDWAVHLYQHELRDEQDDSASSNG